MNKGTKKATGYLVLALYILYTALPALVTQYPAVTWLITLSAVVGCLWRGRDYLIKGDAEDAGDKLVGGNEDNPIPAPIHTIGAAPGG